MPRCGPSPCAAAGAATATCRYLCCTPLAAPSSWARVSACAAQQRLRLHRLTAAASVCGWTGAEPTVVAGTPGWHPGTLAACQPDQIVGRSVSVNTHALSAHAADAALLVGGQHYEGWLSHTMWLYNATEDSWARVGEAPVYSRGHVCGLQHGRLFMALGQQGQGE